MSLIDRLPKGLTRAFGKLWLKTKHASPEICVVGGIVCGAGAMVLVGVKTWKNKSTLASDADAIRALTTIYKPITEAEREQLSEKESKRVITNESTGEMTLPMKIPGEMMTRERSEQVLARRIDFAKDIVKTYWLPVTLEVGSVFLIWKGRSILRKNLSTMTAAYAAMAEAYRKYREKVAKEIGAEREQQLACGYSTQTTVDENGTVENAVIPDKKGNLNPYGFFYDEGYYDERHQELWWRNPMFRNDKKENQYHVKEEQDRATWELRTTGYWRLENTMLRLGQPPKEAEKFHNIGKVWVEGGDNRVDFGVFPGPRQMEINKGFTDSYCSQIICYINPNVDGDISYINKDLEKYDRRYSPNAKPEMPYRSFRREEGQIIERYNKEKMEEMIFNGMSDRGKRRVSKLLR